MSRSWVEVMNDMHLRFRSLMTNSKPIEVNGASRVYTTSQLASESGAKSPWTCKLKGCPFVFRTEPKRRSNRYLRHSSHLLASDSYQNPMDGHFQTKLTMSFAKFTSCPEAGLHRPVVSWTSLCQTRRSRLALAYARGGTVTAVGLYIGSHELQRSHGNPVVL